MLAYKSFEATSDLTGLHRWLGILADELSERLATESQINQRAPRLLVLGYRYALRSPTAFNVMFLTTNKQNLTID